MSRVIRALESREQPLILCRINPRDKRKIDVALTPAGLQAWQDYQDARLRHIGDLLGRLPEEDLEDLHRLLEKVQDILPLAVAVSNPRPGRRCRQGADSYCFVHGEECISYPGRGD